ncbi:MAG: PAS domain S-box protein [Chitinophagaceae bacterium]
MPETGSIGWKEQNLYQAMINTVEDYAIIMLDTEGNIQNWNKGAEKIKGYTAEEVRGCNFKVFYRGEDIDAHLPDTLLEQAKIHGKVTDEGWRLRKDGTRFWASVVITAVPDENGTVIGFTKVTKDITERKSDEDIIRQAKELLQLFVKHSPAAIAMLDNDLRYILASDRWYESYGIPDKNITGKLHYDIFPEIRTMPEWMAIHSRCLQGTTEKNERDFFLRADGTKQWIHWEIHPWHRVDQSIGGLIMFTEVITDRIEAEEKMNQLNDRLIRSNKELEQFAYVASHDLQEPLRMVSSFLKLLERKYQHSLDETAHTYIDFAVDGAERMRILISDLLRFSRLNHAVLSVVAIDCNQLLSSVLKVYRKKIEETSATITLHHLPVIHGNRSQFEQLFQNLVGNALKYKSDRPLAIEIGCTDEVSAWKFYIKDNGIGIDKKYFEKIFIIFEQLHGKDEYEGTGIGLAVCKKIVELHGGTIHVASIQGLGSTFYFNIPKQAKPPLS